MEGLDSAALEISNLATDAATNAWIWGRNFLVFIALTLVLLIIAIRQGASGLISLNLALYGGYAVYVVFPYRDAFIGIGTTPVIQAIISIALFTIATAVPFMISLRLTAPSFGQLSILQNLLLSFAAAGFLMALGYHVFDLSNIYTFSDPLNQLFAPEGYFFYWFVAPLLGLYFLAR